eukprot:33210_4
MTSIGCGRGRRSSAAAPHQRRQRGRRGLCTCVSRTGASGSSRWSRGVREACTGQSRRSIQRGDPRRSLQRSWGCSRRSPTSRRGSASDALSPPYPPPPADSRAPLPSRYCQPRSLPALEWPSPPRLAARRRLSAPRLAARLPDTCQPSRSAGATSLS